VVTGLEAFVTAMEPIKDVDFSDPSSIDATDPEVLAALEELQAIDADGEFTAASDRIGAYLETECGITSET
jgi:hypothetical protein